MTNTQSKPQLKRIFQGLGEESNQPLSIPPAPAWRRADRRTDDRGKTFQANSEEIDLVNAALYLRRPLLVTGKPGTGKTSLAYAVAHELRLGEVLYWPITTRTTLNDGLYQYDAIARLQDSTDANRGDFSNIGRYIRLGPLGTALLPSDKPRVLIVDEIDKSDIDLPNDLLYIFEEGRFEIPELSRIEDKEGCQKVVVRTAYRDEEAWTYNAQPDGQKSDGFSEEEPIINGKTCISGGKVTCREFPLVILTSNGERDFPPPFLRRCVRLTMGEPDKERLTAIVRAHLEQEENGKQLIRDGELQIEALIQRFMDARSKGELKGGIATDQLLNALYLITRERDFNTGETVTDFDDLVQHLWKPLSSSEDQA